MKNCIVFGNCHINPIICFLNSSASFRTHYRIIPVDPIQACNPNWGIPANLLHKCDLFIYQRISAAFGVMLSSNYILSQLPKRCQTISIANAYFTGYYPQLSRDNKETHLAYGDLFVIDKLAKGCNRSEIMSMVCDEELFQKNDLIERYEQFMEELREREQNIDIPIADYVDRHYREQHLFSTLCHPRNPIIRYLVCEILKRISISNHDVAHSIPGTNFEDIVSPIYPSVSKHLNLTFTNLKSPIYYLGYKPLTFEQFMELYITYHENQMVQACTGS